MKIVWAFFGVPDLMAGKLGGRIPDLKDGEIGGRIPRPEGRGNWLDKREVINQLTLFLNKLSRPSG